MINLFSLGQSKSNKIPNSNNSGYFSYLKTDEYYFDSACQTLRPQPIVDAINQYYTQYNACGHRVNYEWGKKVDKDIDEARNLVLKHINKSPKDYTVAFTTNATIGINLVLHQIPKEDFQSIVTTQNEHSSVIIPSMTVAKKNKWSRTVLSRDQNYDLIYDNNQIANSVCLINSTNNYDGKSFQSGSKLADDLHQAGSILLLDACQTFGHNPQLLSDIDFDACFASAHKAYAPSLGIIIIKKSLAKQLDYFILGGSTISDNDESSFALIQDPQELYAPLEPGLQDYAAISGLVASLKWYSQWKSPENLGPYEYEQMLAQQLWDSVSKLPNFQFLSDEPTTILSGYSSKDDGHKIAAYLAQKNIMVRSGYHCVYNYLIHQKKYPPLFRISIGLHNTPEDIDYLSNILQFISQS